MGVFSVFDGPDSYTSRLTQDCYRLMLSKSSAIAFDPSYSVASFWIIQPFYSAAYRCHGPNNNYQQHQHIDQMEQLMFRCGHHLWGVRHSFKNIPTTSLASWAAVAIVSTWCLIEGGMDNFASLSQTPQCCWLPKMSINEKLLSAIPLLSSCFILGEQKCGINLNRQNFVL